MNNVHLSASVNVDGSLAIPSFAVRGLGYTPGAAVNLVLPIETCSANCTDSELLLRRVCSDYDGEGYTTDGETINIPLELLQDAGIRDRRKAWP